MTNIFELNREGDLIAALAIYCHENELPLACANEMLVTFQGHVVWLAGFVDQWEKVQSETDRARQWLLGQGFEIEQGGGGCRVLSRYLENGAFIWATCLDGGGLPEIGSWTICTYGDDFDEMLFGLRSDENDGRLTIEQATEKALYIASAFESAYSTCRNGVPIAQCECC